MTNADKTEVRLTNTDRTEARAPRAVCTTSKFNPTGKQRRGVTQ